MSDGRSHAGHSGNGAAPPAGPPEAWYERLLTLVGLKPKDTFRTDLEDVLASTVENPNFSPHERAMLKNVLGLHRVRVQDVMVPRADILAVASDVTLGDLLRIFRTAGHSRLPVYGETLDDPKGMIHIRDFMDYLVTRAESGTRRRRVKDVTVPSLGNIDLTMTLAAAKILRPVIFVPPSMPAMDLLARMQTTRTHMALVIDEYGGTDGLVSIEDLVETVVGDIEDEHDEASAQMIVREGDTFVADARADLDEASAALGVSLVGDEMADDVDTLGGLVVTIAGRVPTRGELISGPEGLEFEVLDADPRRLKRVRIHRREVAPRDEEATRADAAPARAEPPPPEPAPPPFPETRALITESPAAQAPAATPPPESAPPASDLPDAAPPASGEAGRPAA
ncbi:hemolysin family protein [Salinarimonas soli]|uniref:HlyC/CorC family transporter n=1 Tax=Salinarimonas soli TaxID=1638099 RepID=A0A5B2VCU8_9HYPH|nr:hemolysin family protein [Salinarimonas soli]KAA2236814.1 HlyC/CorC family transporter [Salinarimonas soli]